MKTFLKVLISVLFFLLLSDLTLAQYVPKEKREKEEKGNEPEEPPKTNKEAKNEKEGESGELPERSFLQRLNVGGTFGLTFGNPTSIDASPYIGYAFNDRFIAGVGGSYFYYDLSVRTNQNTTVNLRQSYYGGRVYGQFFIVPQAFLWAEFENIGIDVWNTDEQRFRREWQSAPLVGGGFRQSVGGRFGFNVFILYNLSHQDGISFRGTPWVSRTGIDFYF